MKSVVALAIKTTGPDPYSDFIADAGAAVWNNGEITRCFGELIRPDEMPGPSFHARNPAISNSMLANARTQEEVLTDLLSLLPDDADYISHQADIVKSFLQTATRDRFLSPIIDTCELSRICFPDLPGHKLTDLLLSLGITPAAGSLSTSDCDDTLRLWQRIVTEVHNWPAPLLDEIDILLAAIPHHPLRSFFREIKHGGDRTDSAPQRFIDLFSRKKESPPPRREIPDPTDWAPLDEEKTISSLDRNGEFEQKLPGYEFRSQQIAMAHAVANAFNTSTHLMVEAGTGIGKSLAYLLPSVLWATTNRTPVVISTNTKNLQTQLYKKDLPLIRKVLGLDFYAAIIKGRRNYLCLRKLLYLLDHAGLELDDRERLRMIRVLAWAVQTDTGDMSESSAVEEPGAPMLGSHLSSAAEECMGPSCSHRGRCFLYRARAKSLGADIVVANHSVVFAEMGNPEASPVLPPYAHLIFDEAHNIEDAATSWLSVELSHSRIHFILGRLLKTARRNKRSGLLPALLHEIDKADAYSKKALPTGLATNVENTIDAIEKAEPLIASFFQTMNTVFLAKGDRTSLRLKKEPGPANLEGDANESPSLSPATVPMDPAMEDAKKQILSALASVMRCTEALGEKLRQEECAHLAHSSDFAQDITAATLSIKEFCEQTAFVMDAGAEGYVFWVERAAPRQGEARALAAPIQLGKMLAEQLYAERSSIVFSSATLTVRGSYSFLKKRLGLDLLPAERLTEINVGTPFDYRRQCAVMVPMFLPEPNTSDKDYAAELGTLLAEVFRRTQGRGMTLFTSYALLKRTTDILTEALVDDGIVVLAQGQSGSRENITELFRRDIGSVLMGTHSFWEGVDVVGETLSCLVVTRLPFAVFTDPIIEARCEQVEIEGGNAFIDYSVPSAVIKFRQGFGRLIRHRTDRGIVIVTDRRIITKRYGDWFRRSIPTHTVSFPEPDHFFEAVGQFMESAETSA